MNDLRTSKKSRYYEQPKNWRTASAATLQGWSTSCRQHYPTRYPDVFWRLWSSATKESDYHKPAHTTPGERRHNTGRGNATYMLRKHKASQAFQDHEQHAAFSTKATEQHRLKRQIHKIVHHVRKSKQTNRNAWPTDVRNTWENAAHNEMWTQHTNMTNETPTSWVALIKNLHRAIRNIEQHVQRLIHDEYKERRKLFTAKLADDATGSLDFRTIREPQARPVQFLADEEGTLHTDPMMTDNIMTRAWAEVYKGTDRTDEQVLQDFGAVYAHNITDITMQQLRDAFSNVKKNATGPDAWDDVTLSRLTDTPLRWLTRMLNGIEKGMDWPRHITKAHATCIPKESRASHDPPAYRVLLIMSQIYRKWATMRLKHLETWIQKWTLPQMYAGVPGQGAEQAWWQLSLCLEYWRAKQTQATGRATDIYKCFDQVVRPLIHMTARVAGMPARILKPYMGAIESLQIRNTLTVGYGRRTHQETWNTTGMPFLDDTHSATCQTMDNASVESGCHTESFSRRLACGCGRRKTS